MDKKARRPLKVILLCNLFLALTAAFFLPLEVVLINQKEFLLSFGNIWWIQALAALVITLLLTGLMMILPARAGKIAAAVSLGLGIALWAQNMFMNGGMVSLTGEEMNTTRGGEILNGIIWAGIVTATIVLVIVFSRKKPKQTGLAMCLVAGALTVMQAVGLVSLAATAEPPETEVDHYLSSAGVYTFSKGSNVIMLVLDRVDETEFKEMIERYPEVKDELAGWIHYGNALTMYGRTYPSVPYLLTGEKCWYDQKAAKWINDAFDKSSYLKDLHKQGTDVRVFEMDPAMVGNNTGAYIANSSDYEFSTLGNLNLPVMEENLAKISLYKGAPYLLKRAFAYDMDEVNTSSFNSDTMDAPPFEYKFDPDFYNMMRYEECQATGQYAKAFRFYHIWGGHDGYFWDSEMQENEDIDRPEALRGSFMIAEELIRQMKALGIYDDATIIMTTDHGTTLGDQKTLEIPMAICPMLLVKYPHCDESQPMTTTMAPVSHEDLFATVEEGLGVKRSGYGSGKTLREYAEGEDRTRYYYYTAKYSHDDGEIALREYEINGDANDLKNWKLTGKWWDVKYSIYNVSKTRFTGE